MSGDATIYTVLVVRVSGGGISGSEVCGWWVSCNVVVLVMVVVVKVLLGKVVMREGCAITLHLWCKLWCTEVNVVNSGSGDSFALINRDGERVAPAEE